MRQLKFLLGTSALLALTACASMVHGTTQQIGFTSSPARAKIIVDGHELGQTPLVADLERRREHVIRFELAGYQPFDTKMTRSVSGWIWLNFFATYMLTSLVDFASGAAYNLSPDLVTGQLIKPSSSSGMASPGGIHVTFGTAADSSRTRAGPKQP